MNARQPLDEQNVTASLTTHLGGGGGPNSPYDLAVTLTATLVVAVMAVLAFLAGAAV
ncbi:MAG: hypothetical protein QOD87_1778, partial [Pseudonocardiales bacterium]|nr:hypothetical protein [Pseudonocardiales bacterium]